MGAGSEFLTDNNVKKVSFFLAALITSSLWVDQLSFRSKVIPRNLALSVEGILLPWMNIAFIEMQGWITATNLLPRYYRAVAVEPRVSTARA